MPSSGTPPVGGSGLLDVVLSTASLGSSTPPPSSFPPPFSPHRRRTGHRLGCRCRRRQREVRKTRSIEYDLWGVLV